MNRKYRRIATGNYAKVVRKMIFSEEFKNRARRRQCDFTRNRKMSFESLMLYMLNLNKGTTQVELDRHFEFIMKQPKVHMKQQSYSDARQKVKQEAFQELFTTSVELIYGCGYSTWCGYRLLAIDGSKIQLPTDKDLLSVFGTVGRGSTATTAQASCLYDVLNDVVVDGMIVPIAVDERTLAKMHIEHLKAMPSYKKELVIADRGYPSFDMIDCFEGSGVYYLMRVKRTFNTDIDAMPLGIHEFTLRNADDKELSVRIVKLELDDGTVETLITNLSDKRLGLEAFKMLYFRRWGVEVLYAELKNKIELENFSGRTQDAICQEFFIALFIANTVSIIANESQKIIDVARNDVGNLYDYKVNKNPAVGTYKNRFVEALREPNATRRSEKISHIVDLISAAPVPIIPSHSVPRPASPRDAKYHFNYKSNI